MLVSPEKETKIKRYFICCDIILNMKDIIVIVEICYHIIMKITYICKLVIMLFQR